jgi:hypothetical protein
LFVAFQPKQLRDVVVAEGVHASAKVLARETDFIVALLNLSELYFPNQDKPLPPKRHELAQAVAEYLAHRA